MEPKEPDFFSFFLLIVCLMYHCRGIVAVLANMTHCYTGYLLQHYGVSVQDFASVTFQKPVM